MGGSGGSTNVQFPSFLAQPLETEASGFLQQGGELRSYLQAGTLPPGLMSQVEGATQSAQSGVTGQYAAHGMLGGSGMALSTGDVQRAEASQIGQLGTELFQLGLQESEIGVGIQENVMQAFIGVQEFNAQQNLEQEQMNNQLLGSIGSSFGSILGAL